MLPDDELNQFRDHPGTLEERAWTTYKWEFPPENETMQCWWICNLDEEDRTKEANMICRSLAALRMELMHSRLATTQKLRQEHDKRLENNALAVDRIQDNRELWFRAGGCEPNLLLTPTELLTEHATSTVEQLHKMLSVYGSSGGLDSFVEDITNAVKKIKIVSWEAIKKDRFSLTPDGIYNDLVRNTEHIISSWGRDYERRQTRMRRPLELDAEAREEADKEVKEVTCRLKDKHELDIDKEFRRPPKKRFANWEDTLKSTNEVLIDEMLTLLELHYEDVSVETHKRSKTIFGSVAFAHRKKLNQKLVLPTRVKEIMRCAKDEVSIPKLELLLHAVRQEIEAETIIYMTSDDDIENIARAIETCTSKVFYDELGEGCRLPKGSRLMIEVEATTLIKQRKNIADLVRAIEVGDPLKVKLRPLGTCREPLLDTFARDIMSIPYTTIRQLINDNTIEDVRDKMLLVLWDALFLSASEAWTNQNVANTTAADALELGWWFQKGQTVSNKPLFEGICSMCGCLLYGVSGRACLSNVYFGPPINRDGTIIKDGTARIEAQPPFLLRFSPQLFAKEAPEIFEYDPATNRLRLKEGKRQPWLKSFKNRSKDEANTCWLYCYDCKVRYCPDSKTLPKTHLPYRDRSSQLNLRPFTRNLSEVGSQSQPEPEAEPIDEITDRLLVVPEEDGVVLPEEVIPKPITTEYPSLQQYEKEWNDKLTTHSKTNEGQFDTGNLIPTPIPNMFQDAPHVAFDKLRSSEAQSRLSVCRPFSAFEHPTFHDGVPRYSSITGEINFRRRATRTLASMMGFVLNKHNGSDMKNLKTPELEALHECSP